MMLLILTVISISVIGLIFYFLISSVDNNLSTIEKNKKTIESLKNTKQQYNETLEQLRLNPNNPTLKQTALQFGREYSALTRQFQGQNKAVTVYDEMALMNDINAACAGAISTSPKAGNLSPVEERLAKFSDLKNKNLISEQEYNERRQKILDEI